jgi:hypothetical protein
MARGSKESSSTPGKARSVHSERHRDPDDMAKRLAELRGSKNQAVGYAPTFLFEMPGDEVAGIIKDFRGDVGKYASTLVVLERPDKSYVSVWLGADLAMKIRPEHVGKDVTIVYVEDLDLGEGNPMRLFEVFYS